MVKIVTELLDRLAEESGAKVEIDAEGTIVVTPATDPHVVAASELLRQLANVEPSGVRVVVEGPRWAPLGGEKPSYVPDLSIVEIEALGRRDDFSLDPPPVLVVEVLSPETRRRDLGEKADAYFQGGARAYWTIELAELTPVDRPTLVVWRRGADGWTRDAPVTGTVGIRTPFDVTLDLERLAL